MASLPQVLARQMVSRMAGASPMGPAAPAAMNGNQAGGQQVAQQLAELQGADPQAMMKSLQQVKEIIVAIYPRAAMQVPGVARNLAQAVKYIDNGISEAEKASATVQAVSPIANNAGIPNPQATQGIGLQDFASGGGAQ